MSAYPTVTDPTAVVGRRFGAYLVDGLVVAAIFWGLFFATAGIILYEVPSNCRQIEATPGELSSSEVCTDDFDAFRFPRTDDSYSAATYRPIAWAIGGGAALFYVVVVEWFVQGLTGATLGKAIFGIRTVNEGGQAPGIGKQFIRGVLWIVDGLCNGLVALVTILASKGHRRVGDMAAQTFVVKSGFKGAPIVVPGMDTTPAPADAGVAAATSSAAAYQAAPAAAPPTSPPPPQPPEGPIWDAPRGAYIQWDPSGNRWLTYDDAASAWKPIAGEQPPPPS
jgi:uncharacterized RDD family membrane protein YckC